MWKDDGLADLVGRNLALGRPAVYDEQEGWAWLRDRRHHMVRYPLTEYREPDPGSVSDLLKRPGVWTAEYLTHPRSSGDADGVHYVANRETFGLDQIRSKRRSRVRKALREFNAGEVHSSQIRRHGFQAHSDTMARHGLRSGGPADFSVWVWRLQMEGYRFWSAWQSEGQILAWLAVLVTGPDALIPAAKSVSSKLSPSPNEALVYTVASDLFESAAVKRISYGMASIEDSVENNATLDHFKTEMGFHAVPVVRHMVLPFAVRSAIKLRPTGWVLNKGSDWFPTASIRKMAGLATRERRWMESRD